MNLKDKTFVVYTDGVTEGYLKNGEELGAEGVQNIIQKANIHLDRKQDSTRQNPDNLWRRMVRNPAVSNISKKSN